MADTMGMKSINVDTFSKVIKEDMEDNIYDPILGLGKAGIGKTMSVCELARELNIGYKEMRLITLSEQDLIGIPDIIVDEKTGRKTTTYDSNDLLPYAERDGEEGILVFDEITSCSQSLRAAAYQLMDGQRSIGNYKLPEKWKIVAIGNGMSDGGVFTGLESAFMSRCMCYDIVPELECWVDWALKNNVNPSIIAFLKFQPQMIHKFNNDEIASVFPCPRSWVALSKRLNSREKRADKGLLSIDDVELYAAGSVGDTGSKGEISAAAMFAAFYTYKNEIISPEEIIAGRASARDFSQAKAETCYLTIETLSQSIIKGIADSKITISSIIKGDIPKSMVLAIENVTLFFIEVYNYRPDYSLCFLQDLSKASVEYSNILMFGSKLMSKDSIEKIRDFMKKGVIINGAVTA